MADIQLLLSGNVPSDGIELPFVRKSGEQFWGLVNGTELMGSRGQPIAYLMSVADISAQKRAEHAMRALFSRLVDRQEKDLTGDLMQQAVKKNVEQGVQNLINDLLKKNE